MVTITKYVWDTVSDCVLSELDENNAVTAVYTNEPQQYGGVLSQRRGTTSHYHHHDALGSTRFLTDSSGNVTDTYLHDAWGNLVASTGTTVNPFKWVGKYGYYTDDSTGQVYVRARMYQPTVARWMSEELLPALRFIYEYNYCANQSSFYIDPSGWSQLPPLPPHRWLNVNPGNTIPPQKPKPPCEPTGGPGSCCLGIHCYDVYEPTGTLKIGRHCGITVYENAGKVVWIDAHPVLHPLSMDPENCMKLSTGVDPKSRRGTSESVPVQATADQCNCAYSYMSKFTGAPCIKYHVFNCNSNWAFNCLVTHCKFTFKMPPGNPPTAGATCEYCAVSGLLDNGGECCLQTGTRTCP